MKKGIKDIVREAIEPTVVSLGYRIWDITYGKIGADYHLEITIDSDRGIYIEDCERVHRSIVDLLDDCLGADDFDYLKVSSPGIERELRTDEHISLSVGQKVEAKLFAPIDGVKSVSGKLESFSDGVVTISFADGEYKLSKSDISKLKTVYFDGAGDENN